MIPEQDSCAAFSHACACIIVMLDNILESILHWQQVRNIVIVAGVRVLLVSTSRRDIGAFSVTITRRCH